LRLQKRETRGGVQWKGIRVLVSCYVGGKKGGIISKSRGVRDRNIRVKGRNPKRALKVVEPGLLVLGGGTPARTGVSRTVLASRDSKQIGWRARKQKKSLRWGASTFARHLGNERNGSENSGSCH